MAIAAAFVYHQLREKFNGFMNDDGVVDLRGVDTEAATIFKWFELNGLYIARLHEDAELVWWNAALGVERVAFEDLKVGDTIPEDFPAGKNFIDLRGYISGPRALELLYEHNVL